ncbi:MAG: relaxase domain-containing protein [Terrimicrobiaceae bacterium]
MRVCCNGHEWAKRQLEKEALGYESLDNGFLSCEKPERLAEICRRLGPIQLKHLFEGWVQRLPWPLSVEDRRAGYHHELALWQLECSRTDVFGREFFEAPTAGSFRRSLWRRTVVHFGEKARDCVRPDSHIEQFADEPQRGALLPLFHDTVLERHELGVTGRRRRCECASSIVEALRAPAPYREQLFLKHSAQFGRMLSPKTQTNFANAKGYFEEHLCVGDYYTKNRHVQGIWTGAGAVLLGLELSHEAFLALCENQHPSSGEGLTQRQKTTRMDKAVGSEATDRRVFFDFAMGDLDAWTIQAGYSEGLNLALFIYAEHQSIVRRIASLVTK